jgi:hypothetical protein
MNAIDRYMPVSDIRECHDVDVHAPAWLVFDVAEHFDIEELLPVRAIFWLRMKFFGLPYKRLGKSLVEATTELGWGRLSYMPQREIVMGAVTQPWVGDVKFRAIPHDRFEEFDEPDLVKIAWTLEAHGLGAAHTRFRSQTRVLATDSGARKKFATYWQKFGVGIVAIRYFVGTAIKREAERRFQAMFSSPELRRPTSPRKPLPA